LVRDSGAEALGVAAMVDRSTDDLPFPFVSLARVEAAVFDPEACPLCDDGVPLDSPGSRHLA
jgi:orotate phosphoribosyltransferase